MMKLKDVGEYHFIWLCLAAVLWWGVFGWMFRGDLRSAEESLKQAGERFAASEAHIAAMFDQLRPDIAQQLTNASQEMQKSQVSLRDMLVIEQQEVFQALDDLMTPDQRDQVSLRQTLRLMQRRLDKSEALIAHLESLSSPHQ